MGLGSSVARNITIGFIPEKSHVFLDNYFNSLPLLEHMRKEKLYVTGTIRTDRIEKAPLKDLKKSPRGSIDVLRDQANGISIYRWHDNSQVTMATNRNDVLIDTKSKCQRYSSSSKGKIDVPQPSIIAEYNNSMGGVDLFDQFRATHRITIRSKKWY
ncbi:hypothetical protein NQ314_009472 [Rhamnusium bicolor]|uniref:PiggyBac transposable element-derived protein domain-containing protein n=1 Tax=Rhamnusium bicolor TaxID=1586634 RepID=A0AAV8XZA8_9CUCU|nr:hypothetical protein NQ314_009472 [Rhamnusium bicolor]